MLRRMYPVDNENIGKTIMQKALADFKRMSVRSDITARVTKNSTTKSYVIDYASSKDDDKALRVFDALLKYYQI